MNSSDDGDGLFVEAAILARRGRYSEAARLLSRARESGRCTELEALDLEARMHAQQGEYLAAEECWRRARSLSGEPDAYKAELRRLRGAASSSQRRPVVLAAGLLLLAVPVWQLTFGVPAMQTRLDRAEAALAALRVELGTLDERTRSRQEEISSGVTVVGGTLHQLDARLTERVDALPTVSRADEDRAAILNAVAAATAELHDAIASVRLELHQHLDSVASGLDGRIASPSVRVPSP